MALVRTRPQSSGSQSAQRRKRKGRAAGNQRSNKRKRTREEKEEDEEREEEEEENDEEREEEEVSSAGSSPLRELHVPDEMYDLDESVWETIKKARGDIKAKLGLFFKPSRFLYYRAHHLVPRIQEPELLS
jgi:hypothetical protein